MAIKSILLLLVIIGQIVFFYRNQPNLEKNIIFSIISLYCLKLYLEKYIGFLDTGITIAIIIGIFISTVFKFKKTDYAVIDIKRIPLFIIIMTLLVFFNGVVHSVYNGEITPLYLQGFFNVLFISVLVLFVFSNLDDVEELLSISKYTLPSFILLMFFGYYDYLVLGMSRIGSDVNPNYYAQMTIILFVLYIFNSKKIFSISNLVITLSVIILVVLSDSSSAKISLIILSGMTILYIFRIKHSIINFIGPLHLMFVSFFTYKTINFSIDGNLFDVFVKEDLSRIFIWKYTWGKIIDSPLLGHEYNTFRAPWGNMMYVTHNDYLRIMVELGLFGSLLFLIYLVLQFNRLSKLQNPKLFFLNCSLLFITLTYSITHNNINNFMFWLALMLPSLSYFIEKNKIAN